MHEEDPNYEKIIDLKKLIAIIKIELIAGQSDPDRLNFLQKSVLDFLFAAAPATGPVPMNDWSFFYRSDWQKEETYCFHCQSPTKTYISSSPDLEFPKRKVVHCPICGIVSDLPESMDVFNIRPIGQHQLQVSGLKMLKEGEQLSLQCHYPNPVQNQCWVIPNDYDFLNDPIHLPDNFFKNSPLFISLILMSSYQFGLVKIPVRGEAL